MRKFNTFIVVLACVILTGCTKTNRTTEILEEQGYTDITIDGAAWFGCGEDDTFRTKFTATNAQGKRVSGIACSGLAKGTTLRF